MSDRYEAWLDVWCFAWYLVGEWHLFETTCGPASWVRLWHQRGVMMGLMQAELRRAQCA